MVTCFGTGGADKLIPMSILCGEIEFYSCRTVFSMNCGVFLSAIDYFDQGEIVGLGSTTRLEDFFGTFVIENMFC